MLHLQPKPEIQLRPWIGPFSTQHSAVYDVRRRCFAITFISNTTFITYNGIHVWKSAKVLTKCNCETWAMNGNNHLYFLVGMLFRFLLSQEEMVRGCRIPQGLHVWTFLVKWSESYVRISIRRNQDYPRGELSLSFRAHQWPLRMACGSAWELYTTIAS